MVLCLHSTPPHTAPLTTSGDLLSLNSKVALDSFMKIGLGTVQFGLDYGISNPQGITPATEVKNILKLAGESGITILDTAVSYGRSEEIIGQSIPDESSFKIVTKTPIFKKDRIDKADATRLKETFLQSLKRVKQPTIYGILVHHANDLLVPGGLYLWQAMEDLKATGLVKKIGVSVYTSQQVDKILDQYPVDIIQLPINVLDQRMLLEGHLSKLKSANIEIHARSVFLQGLLLLKPETLPAQFNSVKIHLKHYHETLQAWGITPVQSALGFVLGLNEIDVVICGVNHHQQLEELCKTSVPMPASEFHQFATNDETICNPSQWYSNAEDR